MAAPLAAADVSVSFDGLAALSNVTLEVSRGRARGLIGPNGAGKTTLLEVIAATVEPSECAAKSEGVRTDGRSPEDIARLGVSMVPEGREVFTSLTVDENLRVGVGMRADHDQAARELEEVCATFPMSRARAESPAGALSGGQCDRGRVGDAFHASVSHDSQIRDSGRRLRNEGFRAKRAYRANDAKPSIEGGAP
jgi:branched-chain amino acid transport system ATP-binding protein